MTMKKWLWVVVVLIAVNANAALISLNFSENSGNQPFTGGQNIGPLATDSSYWNTTDTRASGTLVAGTKTNLVDDTGTPTGADVTWTSANTWWNHDGTGTDEQKLSVGYLDDTETVPGIGVQITVSNIPYSVYKVYGLLAGDANQGTWGDGIANSYLTQNFSVNGAWVLGGNASTTAPAFGSIENNNDAHGTPWTELVVGVTTGNYWTINTSGSTLTVQGLSRYADGDGATRGTFTALIIEQIPEPSVLGLFALFGSVFLLRRRNA